MKKTTRYKFEPSWREATYKSGKYHTDIEERVREYIETGDTDEEYLQFSFFYPAWKVIKAEIDKRKARNARARELRRLRRERQLAARAEQEKQPVASQPNTVVINEGEAPHEATHSEKTQTNTPPAATVKADGTTANRVSETRSLSAQKRLPQARTPRHSTAHGPRNPHLLQCPVGSTKPTSDARKRKNAAGYNPISATISFITAISTLS